MSTSLSVSLRALSAPARGIAVVLTTLALTFTLGTALAPAQADAATKKSATKKAGKKKLTQAQLRRKRTKPIRVAVKVAANQKGDPYRYGAAGPNAFDCSGLTFYSFKRAGFRNMPRTSSAQAGFTRRISRAAMKRGDLVFFHRGGSVYHVGIYGGRNKQGKRFIIHAPYGNRTVTRAPIWTDSWFAGTVRHRL